MRVEKCKYCLSMGETIMHAAARYKTDWIQSMCYYSMCYYSMCSKAGQQPVQVLSQHGRNNYACGRKIHDRLDPEYVLLQYVLLHYV